MSEATEIIRAAVALDMLPPEVLAAVRNRTRNEPMAFKFDRYQISDIRRWLLDNPRIDEAVHIKLQNPFRHTRCSAEVWKDHVPMFWVMLGPDACHVVDSIVSGGIRIEYKQVAA